MTVRNARIFAVTLAASIAGSNAMAGAANGPVAEPALRVVARGTPMNAHFTLDAFDGEVGRRAPIYEGYRPQFVFWSAVGEVSCAIHIHGADHIDPGTSARVVLSCIDDARIPLDGSQFQVREAGHIVGHGVVEN